MEEQKIVGVKNLTKLFPVKGTPLAQILMRKKRFVHAVEDVSFDVDASGKLAIIGESGSGKTTLAKLILGLLRPTSGNVYVEGQDIFSTPNEVLRSKTALIFQDPYSSTDPRMKINGIVAEPLRFHEKSLSRVEIAEKVAHSLESVNLVPVERFIDKRPNSLSGGELQRVCLARALIHHPKLLILDEAVSMLDASIKASILNLLMDLQSRFGLAYIFISHDIAAGQYTCDNITVMHVGKFVEKGSSESVLAKPLHPYTKSLIQVVPTMDQNIDFDVRIGGVPANPADPPRGCRFHPRCPFVMDKCRTDEPELIEVERDHFCACHSVA